MKHSSFGSSKRKGEQCVWDRELSRNRERKKTEPRELCSAALSRYFADRPGDATKLGRHSTSGRIEAAKEMTED